MPSRISNPGWPGAGVTARCGTPRSRRATIATASPRLGSGWRGWWGSKPAARPAPPRRLQAIHAPVLASLPVLAGWGGNVCEVSRRTGLQRHRGGAISFWLAIEGITASDPGAEAATLDSLERDDLAEARGAWKASSAESTRAYQCFKGKPSTRSIRRFGHFPKIFRQSTAYLEH